MKLLTSSAFACVLLLSAAASVSAQTDDGFTTQPTTAGWGLVQPDEETVEQPDLDLGEEPQQDTEPIIRDGQQFGWQFRETPVDSEGQDGPLSELDRLSTSASGIRYGSGLYDPKSDNPLIPTAVTLRALDKITAKYTDLTIKIDETSTFGDLSITPRTCDTRPPEEFPETTVFLEIDDLEDDKTDPDAADALGSDAIEDADEAVSEELLSEDIPLADAGTAETIGVAINDGIDVAETTEEKPSTDHLFSGWMFASSPALNALQHPVYDVWVIACTMVDPATL